MFGKDIPKFDKDFPKLNELFLCEVDTGLEIHVLHMFRDSRLDIQ